MIKINYTKRIMKKINIYDILNSKNAILHSDGIEIFEEAEKLFDTSKEIIELDFTGIKRLSTLFLNASYGRLLAKYGSEKTRNYFQVINYSEIPSFTDKFNDMWDNFENRDNYQAYRELDFA